MRELAAHTHELPDGIRKEFNRVTLDCWLRGYREFRLRVWGAESRVTSIRPEALRAGDASKERVVLPLQARPTHLRAECRVRPSAQAGRIDPGQCAELPHGGLPLPNDAGRRQHLVFRCVPRGASSA